MGIPRVKARGREFTVILGAILIDHPKYAEEFLASADGLGINAGFDMPVSIIHAGLCFSTLLYSSLKRLTYMMMMMMTPILVLIQQAADETSGVRSTSHLLPPDRLEILIASLSRLNLETGHFNVFDLYPQP